LGIKIKFVKDSVVHHFGGGASTPNKKRTFYQERNRWLNLYTFFSIWFIIRLFPVIFTVKTAGLFRSLISKKQSFAGVLKAYLWFYFHIPAVIKKRKKLKLFKKINEKEVIRFMTSKLLNHETGINKLINTVSYYYSRLMGIKPIEYFQKIK
jgi:GT2 family glycosyltransferase